MAVFVRVAGLTLIAAVLQVPSTQPAYVSFCEIVKNPDAYDQRVVMTSGIWGASPEFSSFLDPSCQPGPDNDVATSPVPIRNAVLRTDGWRRLETVLKKNKRAFVVIRGVFDAYRRYESPPQADPALQDLFKKAGSRFGH